MNIISKIYNGLARLEDQEKALDHPFTAYIFAKHVVGADIERCQEVACRDSEFAYLFAVHIKEANIEKCQEAACKTPSIAHHFARNVSSANLTKCLEACKGTFYEDRLNKYLMERALR